MFKQTEFYDLEPQVIKQILESLDSNYYPCHRQKGQEFAGHTTVSIVIDILDYLPKRFEIVHVQRLNKTFVSPRLTAMIGKVPFEKLVLKDYEIWARHNILPGDKIVKFSWMVKETEKLEEFCKENSFHYDEILVADMKKDFEHWSR